VSLTGKEKIIGEKPGILNYDATVMSGGMEDGGSSPVPAQLAFVCLRRVIRSRLNCQETHCRILGHELRIRWHDL
jgi:hypothetical protein